MNRSLLLTGVPREILERLQEAATLHQRTLEEEAVHCLGKMLLPIRTTEELIARSNELRQQFVHDQERLADMIRRLEDGSPCLL